MTTGSRMKKMLIGLQALALCAAALAQTGPAPTVTPPAAVTAPETPAPAPTSGTALTAVDAEAFIDGLMPSALRAARVPGAVVVVVKDGQPLLQKGYGHADRDKRLPVDPHKTLFRPGSVSKLFTWVAVMQLVEQGKLELDVDLNKYLDFAIPGRNGKALTLRHVMTHTTGFEETARDLLTYTPATPDLGKVLKGYIPPYVYDPGTTPGYSNYATALAGYIVQRVSGKPFDDYMEQQVFAPLGMQQSTFRQPLPKALEAQMSQGYMTWDDKPKGFEIISMPPAGSMSAPGADMGRFMSAMLQQGRLGDAQILKPETVKQMFGQLTQPLPDLMGIGLGFYEQNINGHRVLAHGGDTVLFHSDLLLFVDKGIGLYVSVNAAGHERQGAWLRDKLFEAFADRYLPDQRPATKPAVDEATAKLHAQQMAGAYRNTRREDSTWLSVLQLLSPLKVQALEDGRLSIDLAGARSTYREVKPYFWEEEHGKRRLQAIVENGKVKHWGLEPFVFAFIFEPVPFMASPVVLVMAGLAIVALLLTVLLWPVAAVLRRRHHVAVPPTKQVTWVRGASVLAIVALGLWGWVVALLESLGDASLVLPLAQLALAVSVIGGLVVAGLHARSALKVGDRWTKALAIVWVLAFAVLLIVATYHHLIGFNQNY
ncbi:serine hydrolase [Roseateles asaccharophilus]|uniref:CubicO group peptidase (Beta-lactamase class C family) n=1 Tax=Roseateles asaccharophilus TaxID=582607 RepID=A0ABU2A8T0_9BURK|nr:serine hydrolase [Roseateles asaccharophilus]MDR7333608.1 CubicO group peptidase (beta-lactamase class C family) [Roseateles asaccharophilus]